MSDTHTFINQNKFQFTVKLTWYEKLVAIDIKPEEERCYDLMVKYKMNNYLHNTIGPAIIVINTGAQSYWIDGKQLTEEDAEKIIHMQNFNNTLNGFLKS
jgi:hypothetical protein